MNLEFIKTDKKITFFMFYLLFREYFLHYLKICVQLVVFLLKAIKKIIF